MQSQYASAMQMTESVIVSRVQWLPGRAPDRRVPHGCIAVVVTPIDLTTGKPGPPRPPSVFLP